MTVQQILDRAFARSRRWIPEGTGTASPEELVPAVQDSLNALFQIAARVNGAYFGASKTVSYAAPGWKRPDDAESIDRIERASGEEVVVVPMDQRQAEPGFPCVYRWGGLYRPAGVTPGPNAGEPLTFFYSRMPAQLASPASAIDPAYPTSHLTLLELDVAIRIALKDGGPSVELVQPLRDERTDALHRYVAFLEHETADERRSYGLIRKFATNTLVPLHSMLAGGAG